MPAPHRLPELSPADVRNALLARREIALVDVREEDPYAQAHPLFAVQLSAGRIELDAPWRLPRRDVTVAVFDNGEGLAEPAARRLQAMGYSQVHLLTGGATQPGQAPNGLQAWRDAGGELFRDVNVPSKAFGELVEHERHTPSLPAPEVQALLDSDADVVVLDARRFDEYQTMAIPGGTSVPGAELVLRVRDLAPDPRTRVIVNCAGRTRSIIGTQSLVNAGIPNPVAALRNGTIGWTLAGQTLQHGAQRRYGPASDASRQAAAQSAQALADRAGALRLALAGLADWRADLSRTTYCWDVRSPEEFAAGHLPGFGSAPGGQLVQETDVFAAVRGARIVLVDGGRAADGTRAAMTAHWLAQLGWQVAWLTDVDPAQFTETGPWQPAQTAAPEVPGISPQQLAQALGLDAAGQASDTARPGAGVGGPSGALLPGGQGGPEGLANGVNQDSILVLDLGTSAQHVKAHIPGAWWVLRADLQRGLGHLPKLPAAQRIVITANSEALARFAAADLARLTDTPVQVLQGGTAAWAASGLPLQAGDAHLASPRIDRYRRPYEGTDAPREAMQAYLDWEFGLVAQLGRDGTHGFQVLAAA